MNNQQINLTLEQLAALNEAIGSLMQIMNQYKGWAEDSPEHRRALEKNIEHKRKAREVLRKMYIAATGEDPCGK